MKALLSSTFFGPIQWYQKLYRYPNVLIEHHDSYCKQTYRNRCLIATTNGVQTLTVPVISREDALGEKCMISDHGNWRHQHWNALQSAYGDSPFFIYYEDDLKPFFTQRWDTLYDYNEAIRQKMCQLLDIQPNVEATTFYITKAMLEQEDGQTDDFRDAINPKHPLPDADFQPKRYYQVYARKHGFLPNLSILDLLFNIGPESVFFL